jgi:hypothetical protein
MAFHYSAMMEMIADTMVSSLFRLPNGYSNYRMIPKKSCHLYGSIPRAIRHKAENYTHKRNETLLSTVKYCPYRSNLSIQIFNNNNKVAQTVKYCPYRSDVFIQIFSNNNNPHWLELGPFRQITACFHVNMAYPLPGSRAKSISFETHSDRARSDARISIRD